MTKMSLGTFPDTPTTTETETMNDADRIDQALIAASKHWGRNWKQELCTCWMNGRYPANLDSATLQGIRNACWGGPDWLYKTFRLPKSVKTEIFLETETFHEFTERRSPE